MADLTVWAPAKINLHLEVLGLRPDGFHELAMVMQMLDLAEVALQAASGAAAAGAGAVRAPHAGAHRADVGQLPAGAGAR